MSEFKNIEQKEFILLVLTIEGLLFIFALLFGHLTGINPFSKIYISFKTIAIAVIASMILIGMNFLAINELSKFIPFFKNLKEAYNSIAVMASNIDLVGAFVIAVMSGFVEEFFFRGLLQQQFGIVIASIIFGLFHIGNAKTLTYGIYSMFIGLYMGWLFIYTGNLLVPILVHIINNFLALPYMRYYHSKYVREND